MTTDWKTLSAQALAQAIRERRTSARTVVDAHIAHIEAVNPRLNAVVFDRYALARAEADAADARIAAAEDPDSLPPLLGVPCTIKENFEFEGTPQASGLVARRHIINERDAPTVARIRAAGAIPLGVTNTSELCMWMESNNRVYGRSRNPYDPSRIVGGSSGGEGAIIGAGGSPFGLGADVGGSIRMPAFFNGVFGHKPSPGIVPNAGQVPLPTGDIDRYCVTGPLARRAEDLMPLLRILADQPAALGDPAAVDLSSLRVICVPDNGRHRVSPDMREAQARAAASLRPLVASVEERRLRRLKSSFEIWAGMMGAANGEAFASQLGMGRPIATGRELFKLSLGRSAHTLPALALALTEKLPLNQRKWQAAGAALRTELLDLLGDDGVLLYPSYSCAAPRHRAPIWRHTFHWTYCGIINVMELPSTQVPMGLNAEGLPLGVQVVGAPGKDHLTIAVARELERRCGGWVPPF